MTEQPPQDPNQPKPGWYADPGGDQTLRRWWDGRGWAAQTQPMPGTAGPQPPYPGQQPGYLPLASRPDLSRRQAAGGRHGPSATRC